jgi:hypothetical protein
VYEQKHIAVFFRKGYLSVSPSLFSIAELISYHAGITFNSFKETNSCIKDLMIGYMAFSEGVRNCFLTQYQFAQHKQNILPPL